MDDLLSAYLDGMLSLEDRAGLEARLRQEPALVARLDGLRQTKKALASLPQVPVPRNFILSPSMVASPKPTTRPRPRRIWPVFGWATAAATLLFLLVFAGEIFVVKPSLRPEPADVVAQRPKFMVQTPDTLAAESATPVPDVASVGVEVTVELESETAAPAAAAPMVVTEEEKVVEEAAAEAAVPAEAEAEVGLTEEAPADVAAPPGAGGGDASTEEADEMMFEAEAPATEEAGLLQTGEASEALPALTPTEVEQEQAVRAVPTQTATPEEEQEMPLPAPTEVEETEDEVDRQTVEELTVTTTPEPVAAVPPVVTPLAVDTGPTDEQLPPWLRVLEGGLGLTVVVLGAVTLILRRRGR